MTRLLFLLLVVCSCSSDKVDSICTYTYYNGATSSDCSIDYHVFLDDAIRLHFEDSFLLSPDLLTDTLGKEVGYRIYERSDNHLLLILTDQEYQFDYGFTLQFISE